MSENVSPAKGRKRDSKAPPSPSSLLDRVCAAIEEGVFPHVAAQAEGVWREIFWKLFREARAAREKSAEKAAQEAALLELAAPAASEESKPSPREQALVRFYSRLEQSSARARATAERETFEENALAYLRHGPGRSSGPEDPGWTERAGDAATQPTVPSPSATNEFFEKLFGKKETPTSPPASGHPLSVNGEGAGG
ncbi:MAG: hypothetical protein AB1405_05205 [Bdellovibrionota bacterium]